ncbi:MAG TPA: hypothetical protein VD994_16300 [Prosthecobacter sp.]|nr:hypothetical protein [Prosthecobacter sp.]
MSNRPPPQLIEASMRQMRGEVKDFARREPLKAVAACFGAGLLVHLLPARVLAGTASAAGAALVPPVLLFLGVVKSVELYCQNSKANNLHE